MAVFTANKPLDALALTDLATLVTQALTGGATLSNATATGFTLTIGAKVLTVVGTGITYSNVLGFNFPSGGTATAATLSQNGTALYGISQISLPITSLINPLELTPAKLFGGNDTLIGSSGADTLSGFAGDDTIRGGGGKDNLDGGGFGGEDTVDYSDKSKDISLRLYIDKASTVKVDGVNEDTIRNFQNVYGGTGNDTILGDGRENFIRGNNGNDKLSGYAGYDYLSGGAGDDILRSGASDPFGGDVLLGGDGIDTADYADMTGDIAVNLSVKETTQNFWNLVTLDGSFTEWIAQIENVIGGKGSDTLTGDANRNIFTGLKGNDILDGAGGLDGASFADKTTDLTITLNNGNEVSVVVSATETDKIRNIEDLEGGSGNDKFTGDSFANKLLGGLGDDILKGGSGDDTLAGGKGSDTLSGSTGFDKFVFDVKPSATSGIDTITDFNVDQDKILLTKGSFKALGAAVTAEEFLSGTATDLKAANGDQHLIYNTVTGALFFDADGSGTAFAQFQIATLKNSPDGLSFSHFDII